MSFNDWFNLLCIEVQSSKCRSDVDHTILAAHSCCLFSEPITSKLLLLKPDL